ncbi:MAG: four helix bundle protein [Bacteroidetes bacterium]|nr:four helix bundle protein [Bacteroidota bacterium]MCL5031140.1 four helix bundle protein [Bacteroidota bacterium]
MNKNELKERTKRFAHDCVKLALKLPNTFLGNHIKGQLIRCSTSVAANYRAACLGQSKATFISKVSIVIEEADESEFWLEFMIDENLLNKDQVEPLRNEAHELASIFISSRMTAVGN